MPSPVVRVGSFPVHVGNDRIRRLTKRFVQTLTGKAAMANYRCYFLNQLDRIQAAQILECAEDAEAVLKASELARAQSLIIEIWNGARLVGRLPQTAATQ